MAGSPSSSLRQREQGLRGGGGGSGVKSRGAMEGREGPGPLLSLRAPLVQIRDRAGCHGEGSFQRRGQDTPCQWRTLRASRERWVRTRRDCPSKGLRDGGKRTVGRRGSGAVRSSSLSVRGRKALLLQVGGGRDEQKLGREVVGEVRGQGPALLQQFPEERTGGRGRAAGRWSLGTSGALGSTARSRARSAPSRGPRAVRGPRGWLSTR